MRRICNRPALKGTSSAAETLQNAEAEHARLSAQIAEAQGAVQNCIADTQALEVKSGEGGDVSAQFRVLLSIVDAFTQACTIEEPCVDPGEVDTAEEEASMKAAAASQLRRLSLDSEAELVKVRALCHALHLVASPRIFCSCCSCVNALPRRRVTQRASSSCR